MHNLTQLANNITLNFSVAKCQYTQVARTILNGADRTPEVIEKCSAMNVGHMPASHNVLMRA